MDNFILYTDIQSYNAGYIKDGIASLLFIVAYIFIYYFKDLTQLKNLILQIIIVCFIIDFTFTLNPKYHFENVGYNIPSYLIFGGIIIILLILFIHRKSLYHN
jgi:hypothetical protein